MVTATTTATVLLMAICSIATVLFVTRWLPWAVQAYAVAKIHDVRDRLYALTRDYPAVRHTSFYRHLDLFYAGSLHVVRDLDGVSARRLLIVETRLRVDPQRAAELTAVYVREMQDAVGAKYSDVFVAVGRDIMRRDLALILRGTTTLHPGMLLIGMIAALSQYILFKALQAPLGVFMAAERIERARPLQRMAERDVPNVPNALVPA